MQRSDLYFNSKSKNHCTSVFFLQFMTNNFNSYFVCNIFKLNKQLITIINL